MPGSGASSPGASVLFAFTDRDGNPFVASPRASGAQVPSPFSATPNMASPHATNEQVMHAARRPPTGRFGTASPSEGGSLAQSSGGGAANPSPIGMHVLKHGVAGSGAGGGVDKSAASLRSTGSSLPEMVLPMPPADRDSNSTQ